mmetsp:Transcript_21987/g.54424  ORF Transcript_21987/g.54424 Transcript_21987/m.54424 type:complete len:211 (+) Transcript_21987:497-1129(+)
MVFEEVVVLGDGLDGRLRPDWFPPAVLVLASLLATRIARRNAATHPLPTASAASAAPAPAAAAAVASTAALALFAVALFLPLLTLALLRLLVLPLPLLLLVLLRLLLRLHARPFKQSLGLFVAHLAHGCRRNQTHAAICVPPYLTPLQRLELSLSTFLIILSGHHLVTAASAASVHGPRPAYVRSGSGGGAMYACSCWVLGGAVGKKRRK